MRTLIQHFIDFLSLGPLYAILALGLAMVFSVMRSINFAYGELITLAAYGLFFASGEVAALLVFGAAILVGIAGALATERIAFRPIRSASPSTQLVATFGLAFLIQNLISVVLGARQKSVGMPSFLTGSVTLFDFQIPNLDLISLGTFAVLITALTLFLKRTRIGTQMRASAEDFQMARLLGVKANTIIATAFAISGVLAASAAILLVTRSGTVFPAMGLRPVVLGFVAVILGGIGSLFGAAIGGFVLAFLTIALNVILPQTLRPFRDTVLFLVVAAIFVVRPRGLLPSRRTEIRA
jgi:branched-chain amino acid transport system permease protein